MSALTDQDVGGCGCVGCATTITGILRGCGSGSGKVLPGATVTAHDSTSTGTILATAATNSSGVYTLSIGSATAGNSIVVVVTCPRMVGTTYTVAYSAIVAANRWSCGGTTTWADIRLLADVASGYHCNDICALPLASTLHLSSTSGDAYILTWSGARGRWDNGGTPSDSNLNTDGSGQFQLPAVACTAIVTPGDIASLSCPPAFSVSYFEFACFETTTITE